MYGRYRSPTINSAFWLFFLMPKSFEKALGIHRGEINQTPADMTEFSSTEYFTVRLDNARFH